MITAAALASCIMTAATAYDVPAAVMVGIMQVEGGKVGVQSANTNGTYDLGPMQVNTLWVPKLARYWQVSNRQAHTWLRDDGCANVHVAAWILKQKIMETGSLYGGISHYHSATPHLGARYAAKVIAAMDKKGLIRHDEPLRTYRYAQK